MRLLLLLSAILLGSTGARAQSTSVLPDLTRLETVALMLEGVLEGEHRTGEQTLVIEQVDDGVFEVRRKGAAAEDGYRQLTVIEGESCQFAVVSRLMDEDGHSYSRQMTIANLGDITDLTYSLLPETPYVHSIRGSNLGLNNYVGHGIAMAVLSPEQMNAIAEDFLRTDC